MSLINKMLQDLDRRHAMAGADQAIPPRQVRAVDRARTGHEWFWRCIAVLMLAAVASVAWIVYQLQPPRPPLVTEVAFRAAEEAKARKPALAVSTPPAAATAAAPPATAPEQKPPAAAEPVRNAVPVDSLKFALSIERPINEPAAKAAPGAKSPAPPAASPTPVPLAASPVSVDAGAQRKPPVSPLVELPQAKVLGGPASASRVEKRDRTRTPAERAEAEYRRAVTLLNQGRVSEAEEGLAASLAQDPAHEAARQALAALLIEQRHLDAARRVLQEGLAINPAQSTFATGLARILLERREFQAALVALDGAAGTSASNAEFHTMRGTVLQRMARHREAVEAYQNALRAQPANPAGWIGLGISLEALAQRSEAAEAFRRSLAAGPLSADLRAFAEQRVRALQ